MYKCTLVMYLNIYIFSRIDNVESAQWSISIFVAMLVHYYAEQNNVNWEQD